MQHTTTEQSRAVRRLAVALTCSILIASPTAARAQAAPAEPPVDAVKSEEAVQMLEFFVEEKGLSRAANAITPSDVKAQLPGTTIEKLLSKMPGINVVTRDSFGFYESTDIRVRSFGINQVGVTMDDVPMGSNSPRYGLPSGRVTDSENLASVVVSQGAGDLSTPAYEALGGSIKYNTANPTPEPGGLVKISGGDASSTRVFAKYNIGEFYPGVAAWISASELRFKEPGIPEFSQGRKVEAKVTITKANFKAMLAYTYNERDDYDTRSITYDALRALQTGKTYTVYPFALYRAGATTGTIGTVIIPTYAKYGFINYTPTTAYQNITATTVTDPANAARTITQLTPGTVGGSSTALDNTGIFGNFYDNARQLGQNTYIDTTRNLGDGINATNYYWAKNGRRDSFFRGRIEFKPVENLNFVASGYLQGRNYYGTATVPRSSALSQIQGAYQYWKSIGATGPRPDIYPTYAYKDAAGTSLVPFGTPGSTPVGYTDANGNGFFDSNETLNFGSTPTEFAAAHALIGKDSTNAKVTSGIPGHTARYEDFGGPRLGGLFRLEYTLGNNLISTGAWYEDDYQTTIRPQFNILGGSIQGPQLFDQALFINYDRQIQTFVGNAFIQDELKLMDDKLKLNFGAKAIYSKRTAKGWLTTADWRFLTRRTNAAKYTDNFLPQVGGSYKISRPWEVFANYSENFAVPPADLLLGLNNPGIDPQIQGERSKNVEAGVRFSGKQLGATLSVFQNLYSNRIATLSLTTQEQTDRLVLNTVGSSYYTSAGKIKSEGAELGYEWKTPIRGLKVAGSASYLKSIFKDDLRIAYQTWMDSRNKGLSDADYVDLAPFQKRFTVSSTKIVSTGATNGDAQYATALISGMSQLNTPKFYGNVDVSYTIGSWSATFGTEYKDSVYLDALNIEKAPSYVKNTLFISWHGKKGTKLAPFGVSLVVNNLFDKAIYYGGAGGNSPVSATLFSGTVIADQGRQGVFSVDAKF